MITVRIAVALVTVFAFTVGGGLATAQQGPPDKVTLCHNLKDTGETKTIQAGSVATIEVPVYEGTEIEVAEPAKQAHLNHGDAEGECSGLVIVDGDLLFLEERTGR